MNSYPVRPLHISQSILRLYQKGKRAYTLDYVYALLDKTLASLTPEQYKEFVKYRKYLSKSYFFGRIPSELYFDVYHDIIIDILENEKRGTKPDLRLFLFKIKRKYVPNYISYAQVFVDNIEHIYQAFGERYYSKRAIGYKTVSLYLPEHVYSLLEKNQSRSKSIQFIIDLLYENEKSNKIKKSNVKENMSIPKRKKGSVKLPLETYFKLKILKNKGLSTNELIMYGLDKFMSNSFSMK